MSDRLPTAYQTWKRFSRLKDAAWFAYAKILGGDDSDITLKEVAWEAYLTALGAANIAWDAYCDAGRKSE